MRRNIIDALLQSLNVTVVENCIVCRAPLGDCMDATCPACRRKEEQQRREKWEEEERARLAGEAAMAETRRNELVSNWLVRVPLVYRDAKLDGLAKPVKTAIDKWAGLGFMYLYGGAGSGKTHAAYAIAISEAMAFQVCDLGAKSLPIVRTFASVCASMTRERFADSDGTATAMCRHPQLLVIDDVTAGASEYEKAQFLEIANARWQEQLPTIYTGNLDPSKLAASFDDRTASRLLSGVVCRMAGADRRMQRTGQ